MTDARSEHDGPGVFDGDEIVLGPLPKGIVRAGEGQYRRVWNVLGHTYWARAVSESSFAFETLDPPGTGVPPHVHPTQDEHIHVLAGVFTLYLDGQWETAGPGDTVLMPRGLPHAYDNRTETDSRALFWVRPYREAGAPVRPAARPVRPRRGRPAVGAPRRGVPPARLGPRGGLTAPGTSRTVSRP